MWPWESGQHWVLLVAQMVRMAFVLLRLQCQQAGGPHCPRLTPAADPSSLSRPRNVLSRQALITALVVNTVLWYTFLWVLWFYDTIFFSASTTEHIHCILGLQTKLNLLNRMSMSFHVSQCMLFNSMYAIACMMLFKLNVSVVSNILGGVKVVTI